MRALADDDDLVARKLGRMAFAIYASSRVPSATIVPPEDPNLSRQAALIARFGADLPVAARIGDLPIRYQAAKTGLGAAVLPCWLGDSDPDLVRVLEPPDDMIEDVYLLMHRRSRTRDAVAKVAETLAALFKRQQRALLGFRTE
jgi:DNA-binding transcriptional LysR family regulator